jgi:hypothetical protein
MSRGPVCDAKSIRSFQLAILCPSSDSTYKLMQTFIMNVSTSSITWYEWPWSYYVAGLNGCVEDELCIRSRDERR